MGLLFKQVIEGSSSQVLCRVVKVGKLVYGIKAAADTIDWMKREAITIIKIASQHRLALDCRMLFLTHMFRPLEISIARFPRQIH